MRQPEDDTEPHYAGASGRIKRFGLSSDRHVKLEILWLLPAFVAVFLLVGVPFWSISYSKVSVPNSLVALGLIALSLILTVFVVASLRGIFVVMSFCLPALVYARVEVETGRDPTLHNLWPFEIVLALFLGVICVLLALLLGKHALRRVRKGTS